MAAIQTAIDLERPRLLGDIVKDLNERLADVTAETGCRFGCSDWLSGGTATIPAKWRWLSCFVVRGESERYYVHVEVIYQADPKDVEFSRMLIGLCKVWSWEDGFKLCNAATRVLYA